MRHLVFLLVLLLSPIAAHAQLFETPAADASTEATSGEASIDELVKILENDQTRALLIERLQQQTTVGEAPLPAEEPLNDLSIVRQLAEYTRAAAEGTSATLRSLGDIFTDLQHGLSGTLNADFDAFRDVAIAVFLVAVGLFGSFWVLRIVVHALQRMIARRVEGRGWLLRLAGTLGATLVDLGSD